MLSRKKKDVLNALLICHGITEVERLTGTARSTIYKYMKEPEFKKEYDEARLNVLKDSRMLLQNATHSSLERLLEMKDLPEDKISEQTRLQVINCILQYSVKVTEQLEIIERLNALEERANEDG